MRPLSVLRCFCVLVIALTAASCGARSALFRQYEYEEEIYLSLDGSATMFVNSSVEALNALRGTAFNPRLNARLDRDAVRHYFTSPAARVARVSGSRRGGRQYVHVRLQVDDIRQLSTAPAFSWSTYHLAHDREIVVYKQWIGAPAHTGSEGEGAPHWTGDELAAFRIHIPSVVEWHNAGRDNLRRGNIVVWEQPLADRLKGVPLELEVRMEPQSILYRTLILFGAMFGGVALLFGAVIWWIVRQGRAATGFYAE
jgi:hypothetical protein